MSASKPKISVIVPVFNVEKHLQKCLESIASQSYGNLEIVCVDDGSTDGSPAILEEWEKKDSRIKVVHKTNGGLSSARNVGLEEAKGEFVAFADSDDFVEPNWIEKMFNALAQNDSDVCICSFLMETENGDTYAEVPKLENKTCSRVEALKFLSEPRQDRFVVAWNKLYKKELFNGIRFPLGKIHEDQWVAHKLFFAAKKVSIISDRLYHYVIHKNSLSRAKNPISHLDDIDALFDRVEFFKNNGLEQLVFDVENTMFELFGFYREQFFAYQNLMLSEIKKLTKAGKRCFKFFKQKPHSKYELQQRKKVYLFSVKEKLKLMFGYKIKSKVKKWKKI